jgi:amino acid permease-like protein
MRGFNVVSCCSLRSSGGSNNSPRWPIPPPSTISSGSKTAVMAAIACARRYPSCSTTTSALLSPWCAASKTCFGDRTQASLAPVPGELYPSQKSPPQTCLNSSHAFTLDGRFFAGLGAGLIIGIHDYQGYNTTAYMGAEMRNPGRVIPWSIIVSILGIMVLYLALNIGVLGVVPWQGVAQSTSIASLVLEQI